jgi:hypothetical protein
MLTVIKSEFSDYQQTMIDQPAQLDEAQENLAHENLAHENLVRMLACVESLLEKLSELIEPGAMEDKSGRWRFSLNEEDAIAMRVLNYCALRLPDRSISWSEFSRALAPLLAALDQSAFEHISALVLPKAVSCTIDDLKRGRDFESSDNLDNIDNLIKAEQDPAPKSSASSNTQINDASNK